MDIHGSAEVSEVSRGLSELQKFILARALANCEVEGRVSSPPGYNADLYEHEVLAEFFGLPVANQAVWRWPTYQTRLASLGKGQGVIDRRAVGAARYNSARASLSRAVARLKARGLVTTRPFMYARVGVDLTAAGREQAASCRDALLTFKPSQTTEQKRLTDLIEKLRREGENRTSATRWRSG